MIYTACTGTMHSEFGHLPLRLGSHKYYRYTSKFFAHEKNKNIV